MPAAAPRPMHATAKTGSVAGCERQYFRNLDSFVDVSVSRNDALRAVRSRSMKTSAAARSSGDASPSFSSRIPERNGLGGFLTSGGRRVQVLRSSSQRKPMAFIFSACSGVTSRGDEEACRGVGVARRRWNSAVPPCKTNADSSDAFLRAVYNYQAAMRGASSAALLCNLAALASVLD